MADPSSMAVVAFVTSWVTPTSLFLFLNLMIGTLVLSSRFSSKTQEEHHHDDASAPPQISRAPSLLNRVKSFNFSQYVNFDHQQYSHQHYTDHADHHAPPPLARVPSVLQRLKSLNFTQFKFDRPGSASETETVHHQAEYTAARVNEHPPAQPLLQRLKSINFWHDSPNPEPRPDPVEQREPPPLARVPSFLARVKSINFSLYGQEEYTPEEADQVHVEEHHISRVASDTKPSGGEAPAKLPKKMRKSASHKSAFGHFGHEKAVDDEPVEVRQRPESVREGRRKGWLDGHEEEEEEEQIDSKADDFINKFRQELKLQRMDSIVRYKDMLTRAHAAH